MIIVPIISAIELSTGITILSGSSPQLKLTIPTMKERIEIKMAPKKPTKKDIVNNLRKGILIPVLNAKR
ncbi:MAG: hypothetical protein NDF53_00075 [archaeon GB-1867-097]|nr:hypothetical protein [Candidatus Culexmicrobium thermophilum]